RANGRYANWYTVGGYDVIVTLEQFVKNELRFVDEAAARKTGELLAKMHDIAERKDLHVENTVLFDPFGRNDLFDVDAFLSLENAFDGENKALFDAIVRRYHEYMEILSPLKARPRYAVQGDISDCNLYLADNGEIGVFDFNRCGDNILFCDAVMQAVFEARLMVYPEDRADDFEDRILSAFWEGYRAVRAFSADEQRWYPYLYAVIDAFWRCGDVDNLVNAQGAGDAAGVRHWLESIQKRLAVRVRYESSDANHEIAEYILGKQSEPGSFCHLCPQDRDGIIKELDRLFAKPNPRVLVLSDDAKTIQGVFGLLVIPEERYLETDWGFANDPSVYDEFITYLHNAYPGYHLDAVVTKSNQTMFEAYRKNGLVYDEEQIFMELTDYTPKPVSAEIVRYSPEYEASYRVIHKDEGLYWTADRMLQALDKYDVYVAVEKGEAVGYIEMTTLADENEPIQILVKPECRGKGYGRALLQMAIEQNFPRRMVLEVDAANTPALNLYLSLGFKEKLREYLGRGTV
ncbi:MAG: GNAT family N-acetyltransferase, partial [Clostridia bacterium]|nr:GNAT family N-acetyltransferase [Clostridia bacterium]